MIYILLVTFQFIMAQDIPIPSSYVQQNQHNAVLFLSDNGESLSCECSLSKEDKDCRFDFVYGDDNKTSIDVSYFELNSIHSTLLESLRKLKSEWSLSHPTNGFYGSVAFLRKFDHEALDQLILELQTEPLPLRVLLPEHEKRPATPVFNNRELTLRVMMIFKTHLGDKKQDEILESKE